MIEVIRQNDPYRYVKMPDLLENGQPDYRIQKWNNYNGYKDMYLCDNWMQMKQKRYPLFLMHVNNLKEETINEHERTQGSSNGNGRQFI